MKRPLKITPVSKRTGGLSTLVFITASMALILTLPVPLESQTFGQYSSATIASEAEGSVFMSAGKDRFQSGAMTRFELTGRSGLGLQFAFDRRGGLNSWGLGTDLKFYLLNPESSIPLDMALDISYGYLGGEDFNRSVWGMALITSGRLIAETAVPLEPYLSLGFLSTHFHSQGDCSNKQAPFRSCNQADLASDTKFTVRMGMKIFLADGYQILPELGMDGKTTFGLALNAVF
ncbi:MAG: hypothetical protein JXB45_06705 [Candidatus Krumholzibacteriota bacterium]|nr:hypothetical protein [Candidatus Krumholzibacteriota bacterium]